MFIEFLKKVKTSCPWIWDLIEGCNGVVVSFLYGNKIREATADALKNVESPYRFRQLLVGDAELLVGFINRQPEGFDKFFKPHAFDLKTFGKVLKNRTYSLIGCFDGDNLIGYCFIRFVANKSAYRGKIVDKAYQGRGIAKQMGILMTKIALGAGFRLFATISKANVASMQSSKAVNDIRIIKELPNDYVYIEYLGLK